LSVSSEELVITLHFMSILLTINFTPRARLRGVVLRHKKFL
jgi:hypothetical protein